MTNREQQEKIFRAIGFVGDDLIQRADAPVERPEHPYSMDQVGGACRVLRAGHWACRKASSFPDEKRKSGAGGCQHECVRRGSEVKEEPAEDTVTTEAAPAEAEEAPAEEKLQTGEMGASSGKTQRSVSERRMTQHSRIRFLRQRLAP